MLRKMTNKEFKKENIQHQKSNKVSSKKLYSSKYLSENSQFTLQTILNNLDSAIYISDFQSYKIFFMNEYMKNLFGKDFTDNICWKSFHDDQNAPCSFCTNDKLIDDHGNSTGPYVWEFYNVKLDKWYELHDQAIPWFDGRLVRMEIATDITDRKHAEQALEDNFTKLEEKVKERTLDLEEMNTALKILLKKREQDKKNIEKQLYSSVKTLITPYIKKLSKTSLDLDQKTLLGIIEANMTGIISPVSRNLSISDHGLTIAEIKIANFIKEGLKTKEIAKILNLSPRTIDKHRESIRKKLLLKNKKINLQSYLASIY